MYLEVMVQYGSRMSLDSSSCSVYQNNVSILICAPDSCQRLKSNLIAYSPQLSQYRL
jgi:hypothetical protein